MRLSERKVIVLIFLTCFLVYLIGWSGEPYSIDGMVMYQFAKLIILKHQFVFNPHLDWGGVILPTSKWAIGLSLVYMPVIWFFSILPASVGSQFLNLPHGTVENIRLMMLNDPGYRIASLIHLAINSLAAVNVYLLSKEFGLRKKISIGSALVFGVFSPVLVYSRLDYSQPLAGLFLILGVLFSVRYLKDAKRVHLFLSSLWFAAACLTRVELILITPLVGVFSILMKEKGLLKTKWKIGFLWVVPFIMFLMVQFSLNYLRYGSILTFGYEASSEFVFEPLSYFWGWANQLLNPERGILIFFPLIIIGIFGFMELYYRNKSLFLIWLWLFITPLFLYAGWKDWHAGYTWGPRFLISFLPIWIPLVFFKMQSIWDKKQISGIIISLFLFLLGVLASLQGFFINRLNQANSIEIILKEGNFFAKLPYFYQLTDFKSLSNFDSFWVHQTLSDVVIRALFFAGMVFLLGMVFALWLVYFLNKEEVV